MHLPLLTPRKRSYFKRILSIQPASLIGAWPISDPVGSKLARNLLPATYPDCELLLNGDFESAGGGGADIFARWIETLGDGAIADETTLVHGGSHAVKVTAGPTQNTWVFISYFGNPRSMYVEPGQTVIITFWTRGDGTNSGRYALYNETGLSFIRSLYTVGVPGTEYTQVQFSHVVPAGCYQVRLYLACPDANGGIAYFDDVTLTTTYTNPAFVQNAVSTVTFGQLGIGDGQRSALFNGANSALHLGTTGFNAAFDGDVGSVIAWGKVDSAGRWTDDSTMRYLWHPKSRTDITIYMIIGRHTDDHTIFWRRRVAAGIYEQTYVFSPAGPTTWFCMGMRWDVSSPTKNIAGFLYAPGVVAFTKVFDADPTGYGDEAWNKTTYPVDDFNCVLAGGAPNAQLWIGNQAHCYQWAGVALTDAEFLQAMVP